MRSGEVQVRQLWHRGKLWRGGWHLDKLNIGFGELLCKALTLLDRLHEELDAVQVGHGQLPIDIVVGMLLKGPRVPRCRQQDDAQEMLETCRILVACPCPCAHVRACVSKCRCCCASVCQCVPVSLRHTTRARQRGHSLRNTSIATQASQHKHHNTSIATQASQHKHRNTSIESSLPCTSP